MSSVTEQHSVVKSGVYRHAHAKRTPVRLVSRFLKDREAHAFHRWIRPAAEQRSMTRVSWRAATSAAVIHDGCESGGAGRDRGRNALTNCHGTSTLEVGQHVRAGTNLSCLYPTYIRGEAYLAAGQGKEAATEFQKILDHSGIVWNCWTGALAHLGVAPANALQARTSQRADADAARVRALAAYKDFLTLWKDTDPDMPILKEAKAEYGKLQ